MKNLLKTEEAVLLVLAIYLNTLLPYTWWWYWVLFLTPDIGMLGYLLNSRVGAFTYNVFHFRGMAICFYLAGLVAEEPMLQFVGLILLGHISFDRMLGYGLKYDDHFQNTHLGWIGKRSPSPY